MMEIGAPNIEGPGGQVTFSNDVLKIDICGPEQEHLSVVDVPGIFRKKTEGQTTDQDKIMVKSMVESYMQNHRSVILTIVPANTDIATQDITETAERYDKEGVRTLGVLTKPDLVDEGGENAVLDVLNGNKHGLKLGWCVVKNPGQKALNDDSFDRYESERTFFLSEHPWSGLSPEQTGIEALRNRLVGILGDMIEREFPKVLPLLNAGVVQETDV